MILVQLGPGWSHLGLAGGSAALDWFMMVLSAMAGMIRLLYTLVSHLPAGCSHGGGLGFKSSQRGSPVHKCFPCLLFSHLLLFLWPEQVTCSSPEPAQEGTTRRCGVRRHVQIGGGHSSNSLITGLCVHACLFCYCYYY